MEVPSEERHPTPEAEEPGHNVIDQQAKIDETELKADGNAQTYFLVESSDEEETEDEGLDEDEIKKEQGR
jgi:hypothetical protein